MKTSKLLPLLGVLFVTLLVTAQINNGGSGGGLPAGLTFGVPTLTVSTAGSGNGAVALSGTTSGTATFTAPAVAGTRTNGVTMTNGILGPDGAAATPTYGFTNSANGMWQSGGALIFTQPSSNTMFFQVNGTTTTHVLTATSFDMGSTSIARFANAAGPQGATFDVGTSRSAAGVLAVGNATAGDTTGKMKAAGYLSGGTAFATNAGCGEAAPSDGATAGRIVTAGSTSCTTIVTMGNSATAPHGWSCQVQDITTAADRNNPTYTSNATTVTIVTGTIVSGDTLLLGPCEGY